MRYKEKESIDDNESRYIAWLRNFIHGKKDQSDAREFLEAVKD